MSEPGTEAYSASKGGIFSLTHALAISLSKYHITVNSISPGWIENYHYDTLTEDPQEAVKGVDFIHTDVWVSMGEPVEAWADRIKLLLPYQVNAEMMKASGTPRTQFMHCLPAFHNTDTKVGKQLVAQYPFLANGVEVTEEVFESPACIAFDQAENRLYAQNAVMLQLLRAAGR